MLHEREADDAREEQRERDRQAEHDQHDHEHDHRNADGARLDLGAPERRDEQCTERQGGDGEPTPRVGSRARVPRMHDELARELDARDSAADDDQQLDRPNLDREDAFDAGELVRVPGAHEIRPAAEHDRQQNADSENGEQHVPHARRDGVASRERLEEHLDAHQPAVQHCVRELQEHARDER